MTPTRTIEVDVRRTSTTPSMPGDDQISDWVTRAILETGADGAFTVSVSLVDEDESRTLNREYRGRDKPTNVLSFPAGEIEGLPPDIVRPLGDIAVCAAVVEREAALQGKEPASHWAHMLVHGTLHLLGYDHIEESAAVEMEDLEIRILAGLGISNPYTAGD